MFVEPFPGEVAAWPPTRYTPPLRADFDALFDRYVKAFSVAWVIAFGYELETWQVELLRAITELRPDGQLRYRQVIVSLGRQNGKTEIAAALGLLFMLAKRRPQIVGIASSAEQARLVYKRALAAVNRNGAWRRRFVRVTDTRGLATVTGGLWELKASKSAALQGIPIDLGIVDEVHLIKGELWSDLVNGLGGRPNCLVVGITTAGDDSSELLLRLYSQEGSSFGKFIWEAPEAALPEDDETLGRYLAAANPGIASGRRNLAIEIEDARSQPPGEAIRYKLNRFVAGSDSGYMTVPLWSQCLGAVSISTPVFVVERTPDWSFATITANAKAADEVIETEVAASLAHPTIEKLADECVRLYKHAPRLYVMDSYSLKPLGDELKRRGLPVRFASLGDHVSAASMTYAKVARRQVRHPGDELLTRQLPNTIRKAQGDGYRLARTDKTQPIDAVVATVLGVYFAEVVGSETSEVQIF